MLPKHKDYSRLQAYINKSPLLQRQLACEGCSVCTTFSFVTAFANKYVPVGPSVCSNIVIKIPLNSIYM